MVKTKKIWGIALLVIGIISVMTGALRIMGVGLSDIATGLCVVIDVAVVILFIYSIVRKRKQ
ncbi:MAG: DUF3422 domain-containing protein [Lachnospiraceae bacterium]|nr:DUF3422 domain-containing protein [Lachnospiraceae bacterium]MCI8826198.1 DUF3422 domain-containing protein [Lachnospiraceae bacterium]